MERLAHPVVKLVVRYRAPETRGLEVHAFCAENLPLPVLWVLVDDGLDVGLAGTEARALPRRRGGPRPLRLRANLKNGSPIRAAKAQSH